jgi:pimeloyl-ACP methyl ester carboxylesterase
VRSPRFQTEKTTYGTTGATGKKNPARTGISVDPAPDLRHKTDVKILATILIGYALYCLVLFSMQRQILFPRHLVDPGSFPATPSDGMETLWLDLPFGRVESRFLPPPEGAGRPAPLVIFAHGNGELIDHWPEELRVFHEMGMGLMVVEYPGYGRSEGKPTQATITQTFQTAYDRITRRDSVDVDRVVLFGRSLGGGAVCRLAAERPSAALILMSAFTGVRSFAAAYVAPPFLIRDPFDNLSVVSAYAEPVLVLHGRADEVIPFRHGVRLAEAAPRGELIPYPCGHNDFPPGWFTFRRDVEAFLRRSGILGEKARKGASGKEVPDTP